MDIDHKNAYKVYMRFVYVLTITNMAMVWNFEVTSGKCNKNGVCTGGHYA
jgi:hypothetical protein